MVYQNNLVATIKVGGKILRENKDTVAVPFGAEYSVFVKNLSSVRAIFKVSIDGKDTTDGNWMIIEPNSTFNLERYIKNGNFNEGNRFKFIERTSQIEEHRGIGSDDGLVRVEYKFEQPFQQNWLSPNYTIYNNDTWPNGTIQTNTFGAVTTAGFGEATCYNVGSAGDVGETSCYNVSSAPSSPSYSPRIGGRDFTKSVQSRSPLRGQQLNGNKGQSRGDFRMEKQMRAEVNEAGITVAGSKSKQKFTVGSWFPTESVSHVLVLKLIGQVKGQKVVQPVTVQARPTCSTCGKVGKATHKFCGRCGTALELF